MRCPHRARTGLNLFCVSSACNMFGVKEESNNQADSESIGSNCGSKIELESDHLNE